MASDEPLFDTLFGIHRQTFHNPLFEPSNDDDDGVDVAYSVSNGRDAETPSLSPFAADLEREVLKQGEKKEYAVIPGDDGDGDDTSLSLALADSGSDAGSGSGRLEPARGLYAEVHARVAPPALPPREYVLPAPLAVPSGRHTNHNNDRNSTPNGRARSPASGSSSASRRMDSPSSPYRNMAPLALGPGVRTVEELVLHAMEAVDAAVGHGEDAAGLALQDVRRVLNTQPDNLLALLAQRELLLSHLELLPVGHVWLPDALLRQARRSPSAQRSAAVTLLRARPDSSMCQAVLAVLLGEVQRDHASAAAVYDAAVASHRDWAWALRGLGLCHLHGWGQHTRDFDTAARHFTAAATHGSVRALLNLTRCYEGGIGLPQSLPDAAACMTRAANAGFPPAQARLGLYHAHGWGVTHSTDVAVRLYHAAASRGDANAQLRLGLCMLAADGVPSNAEGAYRHFTHAAAQGLGEALYAKGVCLQRGIGTGVDMPGAVAAYRAASIRRVPEALNALGLAYERGDGGLGRSVRSARQHYEQALAAGCDRAALNLALLLMAEAWRGKGEGTDDEDEEGEASGERTTETRRGKGGHGSADGDGDAGRQDKHEDSAYDDISDSVSASNGASQRAAALPHALSTTTAPGPRAALLLAHAVKSGNAHAAYCLARAHELGQLGCEVNLWEGLRLYEQAAKTGHCDAMCKIGTARLLGNGLPVDVTAGVRLLSDAAAKGHADAVNNVGCCFFRGLGIRKDVREAARLFAEASHAGSMAGTYNYGHVLSRGIGGLQDDAEGRELMEYARSREEEMGMGMLIA